MSTWITSVSNPSLLAVLLLPCWPPVLLSCFLQPPGSLSESFQVLPEPLLQSLLRHMSFLFVTLLLASATASLPVASVNEYPHDPVSAANALLSRVVPPSYLSHFKCELLPTTPPDDGVAQMQLSSDPSTNTVILRGTSGVEIASALNWYMNDYLNITFDWATYAKGQWSGTAKFLLTHDRLPLPPTTTPSVPRQLSQSYYLNVCTPGYSLAWSDWAYWQKHIDWMALNGVNLPLALTGTEYVWNQVWKEDFNFTSSDLASFFAGPAFLPWYRMGNMRGWGGPLTSEWMVAQKNLQLLILARQRSLGMTPVLGAFAGFVPSSFATKYPNATLNRAPAWANFAKEYGEVYQLESTDPLFHRIGARFIEVQNALYGTDHIYSCDTFNEMDPTTTNLTELTASSTAVYNAMAASDTEAIWLMQGWLFIHKYWTEHPDRMKAYLAGAPTPSATSNTGMWVLDLFGTEKPVWNQPFAQSYYGKPFILCTLLNFGGQTGLYGDMNAVASGVDAMLLANQNGTANGIGVGITMEGIWTNYGVFEKALSLSFAQSKTPRKSRMQSGQRDEHDEHDEHDESPAVRYATRRYGGASAGAIEAWTDTLWPLYHGSSELFSGPGSLISSVPVVTGPVIPPQPTPSGYTLYNKHGYWGTPTLTEVCSVQACAVHCDATMGCLAFEVYLANANSKTGNCYLFDNINIEFTVLAPCQTFIKIQTITWPEPRSMAEHVALTSQYPSVPLKQQHPTSRMYAALLQQQHAAASAASAASAAAATTTGLSAAWTALMRSIPDLGEVALFRFDLVDVSRAVIAESFAAAFVTYNTAFTNRNSKQTTVLSKTLLSIIDDYDQLLSSDEHFMVGRWINWARNSIPHASATLQDHLEFNARNQITLWGPHGEINDYAKKEWGGLVSSYYKKRYELLFVMVEKTLMQGNKSSWNQNEYQTNVMNQVSLPWSNDTTPFPSQPEHDLLDVIVALHDKYVV